MANTHGNSDLHAATNPNYDSYQDGDSNPHGNAHGDTHSHGNTNSNCNANSYCDAHPHPSTNRNSAPDQNPDANMGTSPDSDTVVGSTHSSLVALARALIITAGKTCIRLKEVADFTPQITHTPGHAPGNPFHRFSGCSRSPTEPLCCKLQTA